ncbi:MAG: hypothetical protein CSA15_02335 [Candidatus Delongbacteria bacterium]|nr:MAG: hypothetical protein CSA15_02335 [Candidatus Delongbacteria bacterium]
MKNNFSPLNFLASLGAGGISVIPFAFFQYTHHKSKGLITFSQIDHFNLGGFKQGLFHSLEAVMIVFTLIHIYLTIVNLFGLSKWVKSEEYEGFKNDPLRNAALMTPFLSLAMSMNVVIGPIRFFIPNLASNLQAMMLPALIGITLLALYAMYWEIKLLKISFSNSFDVAKINFGWLLHPFALGMITVTATGIAAMSKNHTYASIAAFLALTIGSMATFLLVVKVVSIFQSHFNADGLPAKQFMPSFLIVVPIITILAISGFRLSHYFEHNFGFHMDAVGVLIVVIAFAFETWYLLFGIALLKTYLKTDFREKEYYVSQWGLICPFVAYSVLGSFVWKLFVPNPVIYTVVLISAVTSIIFFFIMLKKQFKYS